MSQSQMAPVARKPDGAPPNQAAMSAAGPTRAWPRLYPMAPSRGPARYPTIDRSGASSSPPNHHHDHPEASKANTAATNQARPSMRWMPMALNMGRAYARPHV